MALCGHFRPDLIRIRSRLPNMTPVEFYHSMLLLHASISCCCRNKLWNGWRWPSSRSATPTRTRSTRSWCWSRWSTPGSESKLPLRPSASRPVSCGPSYKLGVFSDDVIVLRACCFGVMSSYAPLSNDILGDSSCPMPTAYLAQAKSLLSLSLLL